MSTIQVANHVSEETAYLINNFPYSFGVFTSVRYWVETKATYGQRLMTQIANPAGGWWKAKTDGYTDIVILTIKTNQNAPDAGFVVPVVINLEKLSLEHLQQFAAYYTFTPFQRDKITASLTKHHIHRLLPWNESVPLNMDLIEKAEGLGKPKEIKVLKAGPAPAAETDTPEPEYYPKLTDDDETANMTPDQLALWREMSGAG